MKKAQLSIFILVGVIIVLVAAALYTITAQKSRLAEISYGAFAEIHNSVQNCIENSLLYSAFYISIKGGYLNPPDYYESPFGNVSYGMKDGTKVLAGIDVIKTELAILVNELIPVCTADIFEKMPQYKITAEPPLTDIMLARNSVDAIVEYKITARLDQKEKVFDRFSASVPIRLSYIHSKINDIIDNAISSEGIDMTYINGIDLDVRILPYKDTKLFIVSDKQSMINNMAFPFVFAVK